MARVRLVARALIPLALVLSACRAPTPEEALTPEAVGVLTDVEETAGGARAYVLADGSRFEPTSDALVYGYLNTGWLVLQGHVDERPWYITLRPDDGLPGCFRLPNVYAIDEAESILFPLDAHLGDREPWTYGLRLGKGPEWTEPEYQRTDDRYPTWLEQWCVNDEGQIQSVEEGIGTG